MSLPLTSPTNEVFISGFLMNFVPFNIQFFLTSFAIPNEKKQQKLVTKILPFTQKVIFSDNL